MIYSHISDQELPWRNAAFNPHSLTTNVSFRADNKKKWLDVNFSANYHTNHFAFIKYSAGAQKKGGKQLSLNICAMSLISQVSEHFLFPFFFSAHETQHRILKSKALDCLLDGQPTCLPKFSLIQTA